MKVRMLMILLSMQLLFIILHLYMCVPFYIITHTNTSGICQIGDLRLTNQTNYKNGRLEVCNNRVTFGTVCDDIWGFQDANVACKQLGFPGGMP